MRDPTGIAAPLEANAASRLDAPQFDSAGSDAPARWPLKWTILLALTTSAALWAIIFIAVRALWTMLV